MALFSSLLLAEGGGGGQVVTYQPAPQPYLPPPPQLPPPTVSGPVSTGVNVPTGIAPVYNPTVVPFTGPGEIVTFAGEGGGLQIPAPAPSQAVVTPPTQSQPPTRSCSTCGPKTSQPPTSSSGGGTSSSTQQPGGALLAGLQPGSENWGLLLLMLALGVALYEGVKERKRGGR